MEQKRGISSWTKTKAKCKLCTEKITLSNMGMSALKSHMKCQKHAQLVSIMKGAISKADSLDQ